MVRLNGQEVDHALWIKLNEGILDWIWLNGIKWEQIGIKWSKNAQNVCLVKITLVEPWHIL